MDLKRVLDCKKDRNCRRCRLYRLCKKEAWKVRKTQVKRVFVMAKEGAIDLWRLIRTNRFIIPAIVIIAALVILIPLLLNVAEDFQRELNGTTQTRVTGNIEPITGIELSSDEAIGTEPAVYEMTQQASGPRDYYILSASDEEKKEMEKVLFVLSRGEPHEGKVAVAAVIINRYLREGEFKDTILGVCRQMGESVDYSWVTDEMLEDVPDCKLAVEDALKGWDPTRNHFPEGARYFYSQKYITAEQLAKREGVDKYVLYGHTFHNDFAD